MTINSIDRPQQSTTESCIHAVVHRHQRVFSDELGTYTGPPVCIPVATDVTPKFVKARPVPFALRKRVEDELDDWEKKGIIEPVKHAKWASPITIATKKNGRIRICGDYRITVNKAALKEIYPLPTNQEMFATLAGGKKFTLLDLTQAYQQLPVDETTAELLTINTTKGLYKMKRLLFGVSTATSIFQRVMDTLLAGIDGVRAYLDDIIITGSTDAEHAARLDAVLTRLEKHGLRVNQEKCMIAGTELKFLGHIINQDGISPDPAKVLAITNAPVPKSKAVLQSWLGLYNFYNCFIQDRASVLHPLYELLQKESRWQWRKQHQLAFDKAKELLKSSNLVAHYDVKKPVTIACDASPYGVGAVLSQTDDSGFERPVAFASRALSKAEQNYSQTDREALAVVFGVTRFHQYVAGKRCTIYTDHKPFLGLLAADKQVPTTMSPHMLRWSITLSGYDYTLLYKPGRDMANADALSRLPLPGSAPAETPSPCDVLLLEEANDDVLTANTVAHHTQKDPILSRLLNLVIKGHLDEAADERFAPYKARASELSVHKGCLLLGSRVVIPKVLQNYVLDTLHMAHPGVTQMKSLARSYVWWLNIDKSIENFVKSCEICQRSRPDPPKTSLPWTWPSKPWGRLHLDFAGPVKSQYFLVVVDAHSKWLEVRLMKKITSEATIGVLRQLFATHGLPDEIVTDNAKQFLSKEFTNFLKNNGIKHRHGAPFHPQTNGLAEVMVRTTKCFLTRLSGAWQEKLSKFLLHQHTTPSTSTGLSPAELLMGRKLTITLDRLHPDLETAMREKQQRDAGTQDLQVRKLQIGSPVYARDYRNGN